MQIICIENDRSWRIRQHRYIIETIQLLRPFWGSDTIAFHLECAAAMRRKLK